MANDLAIRLLAQPITPEVAAELLGVGAGTFDGVSGLTLTRAVRAAVKTAMVARSAQKGMKRSTMRKAALENQRAAASIDAARFDLALRVTARQMVGHIEAEADALASVDPRAAAQLRKDAAAAIDAARPKPKGRAKDLPHSISGTARPGGTCPPVARAAARFKG